jgi:hypothetical protein
MLSRENIFEVNDYSFAKDFVLIDAKHVFG